jgi:hypothetical protein
MTRRRDEFSTDVSLALTEKKMAFRYLVLVNVTVMVLWYRMPCSLVEGSAL